MLITPFNVNEKVFYLSCIEKNRYVFCDIDNTIYAEIENVTNEVRIITNEQIIEILSKVLKLLKRTDKHNYRFEYDGFIVKYSDKPSIVSYYSR